MPTFPTLPNKLQRALHDFRIRSILQTPPVTLDSGSPVHLLTQLQHKDVRMFLVAIKSFMSQVPASRVTVLNDGSLTPSDECLLRDHVKGLKFCSITDYRSPRCPRGGTWERILAIADRSSDSYVIQLDSDTVTLSDLPEARSAIQSNTSFAIGTWDGQTIEPMLDRARDAARFNSSNVTHVQVLAEQAFARLDGAPAMQYVRGCSGFSGFGLGSASRDFIEGFSSEMGAILGPKWSEWGSEQVMSNVVVANSPGATVLPHPKYSDCEHTTPETAFIHFIGSCRFSSNLYARKSRRAIRHLQQNAPST